MPKRISFNQFYLNLTACLVSISVSGVLFVLYANSEKAIDKANEERHISFLLADELRQSSDDLTRMVRTYIATGNPIYKAHFHEIMEIRDGIAPRPSGYQGVYWDLIDEVGHNLTPKFDKTVPLLDLMRMANFTDAEFSKLAEAKKNSDALADTELAAIKIMESTTPITESNRRKAEIMVHDEAYHHAKASIMRPIGEFYGLMDHRTEMAVKDAESHALYMRFTFIFLGFVIVVLLWRTYRCMRVILGCSLDDLYTYIARIGSGDFELSVPVIKGMENSVAGWLSETQAKLSELNKQNRHELAKNQRLTKLYAALSQCNQSIIHCQSEQTLFENLCRDAVDFGGMKMCWIGLVDDQTGNVNVASSYGDGVEYLNGIEISTDESLPSGKGPTGVSIREDRPFWCQDFYSATATTPWHKRGAKFGWGSSCSLPLHVDNKTIGAFTLYSAEVNAFDDAAKNLITEMVKDIDFALTTMKNNRIRIKAENDLEEAHYFLKTIINNAPIRIFWKDRQLDYLGCNPLFARDAGLNDPSDIVGKNDFQLLWRDQGEIYRADDRHVIDTGEQKLFYEEKQTTADGHYIWLRTSKVPLRNQHDEIIGVLGMYENITEQKLAEEHVHFLANFDSLTGLPNRNNLRDHLNYALNLAKRSIGKLALMFFDLDHFKDINDSLGHTTGDALLVELANLFKSLLREEDTVTRLGGDEFIIILPGTDEDGAANVAHKILESLSRPFKIGGYELKITASIGIAIHPNDGNDLETLSRCADMAMYEAKRRGRNSYCFFTSEMQVKTARNMELTSALHRALDQDQLTLLYQPQSKLLTGKIVGVESLIRWNHPELGMISPLEFIPLAEETGLILSIGEWVIRTAVRQAVAWQKDGLPHITVAVNLSVAQFRNPDLPYLVTRILEEEGLSPEYLELELTEGMAMDNPQRAISIINDLHDRGIRISIDDFGTGYSSLSYLKKFKVYKLKIDRSFVRDIKTDPEDRAIVDAVINLSKSLGLKTIAEGVETPSQMEYLKDRNCDEIQGYLISRPITAAEITQFMKNQ